MASRARNFLTVPARAKAILNLLILRNLLLGAITAIVFFGLLTDNLFLILLASLLIPSEVLFSRRIRAQINLVTRQSAQMLTSKALSLRYDFGKRGEMDALSDSIAQIPELERYLSRELSSRISIMILTPFLVLSISGAHFFAAEESSWITFILALVILVLVQTLRWFSLSKDPFDLDEFFEDAVESTSRNPDQSSIVGEDGGEESHSGKIGRIKEIRWTDCQLRGDDQEIAFRWGLASAGRITSVITRSQALRESFIKALLDPWSIEIGRVFVDTNRQTYRVDQLHRHQWQNEVSLISNAPRFASLTVEQNLKSIKPRATRERLTALLKEVGLESDLLPGGLSTKIDDDHSLFSLSLRRRVALARTLLKESAIVILDLSCQDSDAATEEFLIQQMRSLASAGKVVILISEKDIDLTLSKKQFDLDAVAPTLIPQVSV
jgi:ABC-type transport system involved in cytochrome bd biosynthesis fused ATPase/permease subunit